MIDTDIAVARATSSTIAPQRRRSLRRAEVVHWVSKTHGWFGLWGATLGLLFGASGIWLNHRAVLKLPPVTQRRQAIEIELPQPPPRDLQATAAWLQVALQLETAATSMRVEPAKPVMWGQRNDSPGSNASPKLMQPEHWTINFGGPRLTVQAEGWAGNRSVSVRRVENGLIGTLMNLHKGVGMPIAWILLVDTLAGSLILLSLSGLVLWLLTHRRLVLGTAIFGSGLVLTVGLGLSRI